MSDSTKLCSMCERRGRDPRRPLSDFYLDSHRPDGLTHACWECRSEDFQRRWDSDPEFRDTVRARARESARRRRGTSNPA